MINGLILSSVHCEMLLSGLKWFDKLTTNGLFLTLNRSWNTSDIRPTDRTTTPFALSLSKGPSILSSSKGLSRWKGLSLSGCLRWFDRLTTNGTPNARTDRYRTNGTPNVRTSRYCTNGIPNARTSRYCTNRLPNARTDRSCTNRSLVQARAAGFVNGLLLNERAL